MLESKKTIITQTLSSIIFFACSLFLCFTIFASVLYADISEPEFDGLYALSEYKNKVELIELSMIRPAKVFNFKNTFYGVAVNSSYKRTQIPADYNLKAFILKGPYKFSDFRLFELDGTPQVGWVSGNEISEPYAVPGKEIELKSKSYGQNSYFFVPDKPLNNFSYYICSLGEVWWIIRTSAK